MGQLSGLFYYSSMPDIFYESKLKFQRALQHIHDLNQINTRFIEGCPYEVFIEHDPHGADDLLKVKATNNLPDSFLLTLGDAIHNLRASLDYAMSDIEFELNGRRTTYTNFPIRETMESLVAAVNGGLKEKAPKAVIDHIVEVIQPYKGGSREALWCLHELDNEDKHRLLIAKVELAFVDGITVENDAGAELAIDRWLIVEKFVAQRPIKGCKQAKVRNQGRATFNVVFASMLPVNLKPVVPTLYNLAQIVLSTINEIQLVFLSGEG